MALSVAFPVSASDHEVVDTAQDLCFDDTVEMTCPLSGEAYHGQDAAYSGLRGRHGRTDGP